MTVTSQISSYDSWAAADVAADIKDRGSDYYIVSFESSNEQKLYFLMSSSGNLFEANFTGDFSG